MEPLYIFLSFVIVMICFCVIFYSIYMHRDANSKEPSIKKEKSDLWEVTSFEIPLPRDQVTTKTPGDNLKTLRTYSRTTQKNIAEAIGVSRSYISKMENNQVVIPYHIAKRLSSFFNISTNNFI